MASKLLGSLRVRLFAETADFKRGMDDARKRVDTFDKRMKRFSREVGLAQVLAFGAVAAAVKKSIDTANEYDASQRQLAATAKLSGVSLDYLRSISQQAESQFKLTTMAANGFTIELSKLTAKAGDISQTSSALAAFLDIGAARGLTSAQTLQAVKQAILGIDEGTDKLFNANPSVLYAQFAKSIGTTAGKLTDAQKAQAILNAAIRDGAKVRGEYQRYLTSAQGQQELLNNSLSKTASTLGHALQPVLVAILPIVTKLSDALAYAINAMVAWGRALGATFKLIPGYIHAVGVAMKEGLRAGENAWNLAVDQWKLDLHDILIGAGEVSNALGNIVPPPSNNPPPPSPTGTQSKYDAAGERNDILTQDAIERTRIYGDAAIKRLGTEASIADKLRIQLSMIEQMWNIQRNAILADTRLTDAERRNELLRVDLEHEREGIQARINAQLDEELAKQQAIAEAARRRNDALKAGASAIVGTIASGNPSASAIGAGIGTAFSWVPGIGPFLPGVGAFLGGLFGKDERADNNPPPIVKGLAAIERAQRDTITTIKAQTDSLLKPENRFFNLPSNFPLPSYNPTGAVTANNTYSPTINVSLNVNGNTSNITPDDIRRIAVDGMTEALYQSRRNMVWS